MTTQIPWRVCILVAGALLRPPSQAVSQTLQTADDSLWARVEAAGWTIYHVDQFPELPGGGGTPAIVAQIQRLLEMPAEVRSGATDGRLFLKFLVGTDGRVRGARIVQGLSPACDAAALAAVARLPRFVPAQSNGRAVVVPFTLPIGFCGPLHAYEAGQLAHPARFPVPGIRAYVRRKLRGVASLREATQFGELQISYVVGADGRVRDAHLESTPGDERYGQELLRLVQAMPAWQPAHNAQKQAVAMRAYLRVRLPSGKVSTGPPSFRPRDLRN